MVRVESYRSRAQRAFEHSNLSDLPGQDDVTGRAAAVRYIAGTAPATSLGSTGSQAANSHRKKAPEATIQSGAKRHLRRLQTSAPVARLPRATAAVLCDRSQVALQNGRYRAQSPIPYSRNDDGGADADGSGKLTQHAC